MSEFLETPDRQTLEAWDDKYVWHPFTPHSVYRSERPLTVVGGEGNYLIDIDGNRYLDGVASIWCNTFGHRRPEIDAAVRAQLDKIAHATMLGNATVPSILLAKRMVEIAPQGLDKVFFSDNGSTASEIALKMAYQYMQQRENPSPKKTKFLALANAYNGDTIGAVSVGGVDVFHDRFRPMLFDVIRAPSPYAFRCAACGIDGPTQIGRQCGGGCTDAIERLMREHAEELVAVIIEPGFQGAGGMITYPDGYFKKLRALCDELDILLIFDEVAVGMGRSGHMFAAQKEGVTPDLLCLAKMLTGGYLPVAATMSSDKIYEAFLGKPEEARTFYHGHTFTGNPLGCAAALAVLDIFQKEDVLAEVRRKIDILNEGLTGLVGLKHVGDVRTYGLAAGIELVAEDGFSAFESSERRGMKVCAHAREKGVFLRPLGDVIILMPPLSITDDEIHTLIEAVRYGIETEFGA